MIRISSVKGLYGMCTFRDVIWYTTKNVKKTNIEKNKSNFCLAPQLMLDLMSSADDKENDNKQLETSRSSQEIVQSLQLHNMDYPLGARFYEK